MIKNSKNKTKLSYTLLRVFWKIFEIDKKTRCYGTDEQLFEAEIHMIKSIKENEGIHVTGLAKLLGVTKGAVSQIIMKLEKKGMVVKDTDPLNLSRLVLKLTPKGAIAYINHEKIHHQFDDLVHESLQGASADNIAFLKDFLNSLERRIDNFENSNKE